MDRKIIDYIVVHWENIAEIQENINEMINKGRTLRWVIDRVWKAKNKDLRFFQAMVKYEPLSTDTK